jgi:mannose-6-phosphate isomerase
MTPDRNKPFQLPPVFRERVWGRHNLRPFFAQTFEKPVGEVWFECEGDPQIFGTGADPRHPGICPILVKFLFTNERLSVQVHPDDEYALAHHGSLGKTEAWYVLDSRVPGELAVGFREPLSPERLKAAAQSGEIESLLDWRSVKAGDVIFTPAGAVHAIGAGLTICEIQENSDITYRLYDYGRPRELHLESGAKVSHLGPHDWDLKPVSLAEGRDELVACEYFRIERLRPQLAMTLAPGSPFYLIVICTMGAAAGEAWFVPANNAEFVMPTGTEWILTYKSEKPAEVVLASSGLER